MEHAAPNVHILDHDNPESALEALSSTTVDCVVSDSIRMADGTPFVERVRDLDESVPIVLFTGSEWDAVRETAEAVSAAGYVRKGNDAVGELIRRVESVLDGDGEPLYTLEGGWTVVARHDWDARVDLSTRLVEAVTAHTGLDAETVPPLFESIDTDAVTDLLAPLTIDGRRAREEHMEVHFEWAGHELLVTNEGVIALRPLDEE